MLSSEFSKVTLIGRKQKIHIYEILKEETW